MILNSPYITGSITVTGNANVQGTLTVTGSLSGTATSASLALNSNLLQGTGSVGFSTTASLLAVSSSQQQISSSLLNVIANYATTGSNSFRANQSITGSLVVSSTITAQTLVVQTVTSSIVYSSGSNIFGSGLGDKQTFTGSVNITGSQTVFGNVGIGVVAGTNGAKLISAGGATSFFDAAGSRGISIYPSSAGNIHQITSDYIATSYYSIAITARGNNNDLFISSSGNVGIGVTNPTRQLFVNDTVFFDNAGNGSTSNPSIAIGSTSLGISYLGGSNMALLTGGSTKMFISSSGIIGIGTISPVEKLNLLGGGPQYIVLTNTAADGVAGAIQGGIIGQARGYSNNLAKMASILFINNSTWYKGDITFNTNDSDGTNPAVSTTERMRINSSGKVGIGTTGPTTQFQIRKNYWQFWDEKAHGSNVNMFSITFPDFGSAVITVAGSRYSPGSDNYSGTSIFYIYITNVGAVSVNGGNTSGTWTPTTSVASKTVTFASAYAGSSTNYSDYSVVIQASGHSGGSESAAYVTIL